MPSGQTHLRLELLLLPLILLVFHSLNLIDLEELTLMGIAYLLSSLFLSPDLDLKKNNTRRRWGPLGWIWWPYAKIFKHRGISHSLIFGLLTRLFYLGVIVGMVYVGYQFVGLSLPLDYLPNIDSRYWFLFVLGLYIPNILHVLLDHTSTAITRRRRKKKIRHVRHVGS